MNGLLKFLKATIIRGLLFLTPLVPLIVSLEKALTIADSLTKPAATHLSDIPLFTIHGAMLAVTLRLAGNCIVDAMIPRASQAQRQVDWIETRVLVNSSPRLRGVLHQGRRHDPKLSSFESNTLTHLVPVRSDDGRQIGFIRDTMKNGELAVFFSGAASPRSGCYSIHSRDQVKDSGLPVNDAKAIPRRVGVGSGRGLHDKS